MWTAIEQMRGEVPVQDYLRGLISTAAQQDRIGGEDWERRARDAEAVLERVRAALD